MPEENYYCPDNFFKKMTDLESPKKNNDCYFYYYSTCAKGDNCTFRHEPSALGCETMCSFWKEGKCLNVHCNFRHMELRKNRKVIPCYWESQPVGCLKAHCPFLHQNPRPSDDVSTNKSNISAVTEKTNDNESTERKVTAVDSLVVNFEEESDNESLPTCSPLKTGGRIVKVKTLEEIKLEKIQAESAAYYSYSGHEDNSSFQSSSESGDDLRQRIVRRIISKQVPQRTVKFTTFPKRLSTDELANILGDDSLRKKQKLIFQKNNRDFKITLNKSVPENKSSDSEDTSLQMSKPEEEKSFQDIRIKTLAEIRAERNERKGNSQLVEDQDETEVSSTSNDESVNLRLQGDQYRNTIPKRKIKLRRRIINNEDNIVTSNIMSSYQQNTINSDDNEDILLPRQSDSPEQKSGVSRLTENVKTNYAESDSDKFEDVLLLDDDEEGCEDISMKAEDELLDAINSFIDD